jgi:hypothetical protein
MSRLIVVGYCFRVRIADAKDAFSLNSARTSNKRWQTEFIFAPNISLVASISAAHFND